MDADLTAEWQDLVRRAHESLRAGARAPRRYERVMQVVVLPSFRACSCYELFASRSDSGDAFRAAHSIWNLESDLNKFASPVERLRHPSLIEPPIDCREAIADPGEARSLLDSIRRMQIPAIPNDARMGLDGTAVEVTLGATFHALHARWWEAPPTDWEAVGQAADELMGLVLRAAG
jgi:hypothetical protein